MPIRFVLVATRHPGNIGATARALTTMGFRELWLVAPESFPHAEATALAAGADEILVQARVVPNLLEAVADCGLVYATSARPRSAYYWPTFSPREAAPRLLAAGRDGEAALVFGNERTGLSNEELALCAGVIRIPTDSSFESLNLAQAVQVLAYELRTQGDEAPAAVARAVPLAPTAEVERLLGHLDAVLTEVDFTDRSGGPHLLERFRRVFARAELDAEEVSILRGFLAAVQSKRRRAGSGA